MSSLLSCVSKMLVCIKVPYWEAKQQQQQQLEGGGGGGSREYCCVCLSRIRAGEATRRLAPCRHAFHRDCVERWLALCRRTTCPLCRVHVVVDDGGGGKEATAKRRAGEQQLADDLVVWFSAMLVPGF